MKVFPPCNDLGADIDTNSMGPMLAGDVWGRNSERNINNSWNMWRDE